MKTCLGFSREEWIAHVNTIFDTALEDEEIPEYVMFHSWPRTPTEEDYVWADHMIASIDSRKVASDE